MDQRIKALGDWMEYIEPDLTNALPDQFKKDMFTLVRNKISAHKPFESIYGWVKSAYSDLTNSNTTDTLLKYSYKMIIDKMYYIQNHPI